MSYDFNSLIGKIKLSEGSHSSPEIGMCAMEFVSWLEGEKFSDEPKCVCPVIADYVRRVNDFQDQSGRDKLIGLLPSLVGSVAPEFEEERKDYWLMLNLSEVNFSVCCSIDDAIKRIKAMLAIGPKPTGFSRDIEPVINEAIALQEV